MKAFVYAELQISVPFDQAPWREVNPTILQQRGVLNKTWLAGVGNDSLGGIYAFDTIGNAQKFVTAISLTRPESSAWRRPRVSLMRQ